MFFNETNSLKNSKNVKYLMTPITTN